MKYDIVIIGGGPSGLAFAHYCSLLGVKILLIEKNESIGGCHTVYRNDKNLFSEHSPRVYSSAYLNFKNILKDIGLKFEDSFTLLKHQSFDLMKESVFKVFSLWEIIDLSFNILTYLIYPDHGKDITVAQYSSKFSNDAQKVLDTICRMTDGCTSESISFNTFLKYTDDQMLYKLYVPNRPNDEHLFQKWSNYLLDRNVTIMTSCVVQKFHYSDNKISSVDILHNGVEQTYYADNFILAIPPVNLISLLKQTNIINAFGDIDKLEKKALDTEYINYITMTFHWNKNLDINDQYIFPSTEWGLFNKIMSKYMKFDENESKTVISIAVSLPNNKSTRLNKTAHECNKEELIAEVFHQLKEEIPELTDDYVAILEPGTIWDKNKKIWKMNGSGYVANIDTSPIEFESVLFENLYSLGTHNGKSLYNPTTFESAVSNANILSCKLFPDLQKHIRFAKPMTLRKLFKWLCLILLFMLFIYTIL